MDFTHTYLMVRKDFSAGLAQSDTRPTGDHEVTGSFCRVRQYSFAEIDHEIFSTVMLSLPLFQEGQ